MKFLEQAQSFQNAMIKRSRLFTTMMLVSGVGLVVATPFLSREVATIQCFEKSDNVIVLTERDTVVLKNEMLREELEINKLKRQIRGLEKGMDCSELLDDLNRDRDDLLEKLAECEKALDVCLSDDGAEDLSGRVEELLAENADLKDKLKNCGSDNDGEEKELLAQIDILNDRIKTLKASLDECLKSKDDKNYDEVVETCQIEVEKLTGLLAEYKEKLAICEENQRGSSNDKVNIVFNLDDRESLQFNNQTFARSQTKNVAAVTFELQHNGRSLSRNLRKIGDRYRFEANGKEYDLILRRFSKLSTYLEIQEK